MTNQAHNSQEKVLVVGLGITGLSVVRFLRDSGVTVTVADSRDLPPYLKQVRDEFPDVEVIAGNVPFSRFDEFTEVIASPGIKLDLPRDFESERLVGDIELFARHASAPVIAITGSNGKSTVTMLVTEMLVAAGRRVLTGGNIGTPVLQLFDEDIPDFYVLELSSFQLETTSSLAATASTVLNISEDHMDRYQSIEDYSQAKRRIYNNARYRIFNRDDAVSGSWIDPDEKHFSFGLGEPQTEYQFGVVYEGDCRFIARGSEKLANLDDLVLEGDQNVANVLAAATLVQAAGVELSGTVLNAALTYDGLPHRCEFVSEHGGVRWINDSKGTNVGATVAAIRGFDGDIVLIAGGRGKGADFSPLASAISSGVSHTILFGEDAAAIESSLEASSDSTRVNTLAEAVLLARDIASPGSVVLFSPACASFDMFDNFEQRGNAFKGLVMEYIH